MQIVSVKTTIENLARDEGPHIERVSVPKVLLRQIIAALEAKPVCQCCEDQGRLDLVAHLSEPSRLNPLAAAAAVNVRVRINEAG